MRAADVELLMVPGLGGPDPDHWQSRWGARIKSARHVGQDDWSTIDLDLWAGRLLEAIDAAVKPVVLVAHALGVPTVAHAALRMKTRRVVAAFLVAPVSEASASSLSGLDPRFTPYPRDPLPFPSLLVASRNDELCIYEDAGDMALAWGSTLIDAGEVGHLDTASGHGPWPEGVMRLGLLLQQLGPPPTG